MKDRFIVSTTDNIENGVIKQYIDVLCCNIVVGTNIFSDIAASFSDFFGGKSGSYRKKLEYIYNEASKELKNKAIRIGANAIIGFKVDFDEDSQEVALMNKICDVYNNLPDTGKIEKVKSGVFSKKEEEKFICEHGHKNPIDKKFCESCSVDIKGIHYNEAELIEDFKEKVEILNGMLKS